MRSIYACLLFAAATPAAQAAFYVSDTPAPIAPATLNVSLPAARTAVHPDDPTVHKIPFSVRSTQLSWAAKRVMQRILPVAQSVQQVVISGCGEGGDSDVTAYRRGAEVKAWLLNNGVADDAIKVRTGTEASTIKVGGTYQCLVSFADKAPVVSQPAAPRPLPSAATPTAPALPATLPSPRQPLAPQQDARLWMMQSVLEMVATKTLKADDAIAMLDRIMKTGPSVVPPAPTPAAAPAPAPQLQPVMLQVRATPTLQVIPATPREWTLKPGSTLQSALEDWSRQAGWKAPVWHASNPYQVAAGGTLQGDFLDVLRQVSKVVPQIDITVSQDGRSLVITDAKATL
ncbi:TcpQ domain-containing protein [Cupriavidus basilensis]